MEANNNNINTNTSINYEFLNTNVMSMDFFERLNSDICPNGHIRGCFEETFDGNAITITITMNTITFITITITILLLRYYCSRSIKRSTT